MKYIIFLCFSLFTSTVFAFSDNPFIDGCTAPDNVVSYDRFSGNYILDGGSDAASPGLYVNGDVYISGNSTFTGNIYATGDINIRYFSTVNGSVYAGGSTSISWTSTVTGENCRGTLAPQNYCDNPPDISAYIYHQGNLVVASGATLSGNYHVTGNLILNGTSGNETTQLDGNVFVEGDVYLNKKSNITGDAYVVGSIIRDNNGNTTVTGAVCEGGSYLIDLPVNELTEQCSTIFKDAAQSHSGGKLTMWGNSTIEDNITAFDFAAIEQWNNANSCGFGVPCTSTGKQSTKLPDFNISTIEANNITVGSWADGLNVTLGDPYSTTDKFRGTDFGDITVHDGGILTFVPQVDDHIYRINRLNVYGGGTTKLNAGVYAIGGLGITDGNSRIEVLGGGTVYLFVNKIDSIQGSIISDSARVVIVTKDTLTVNDNAQIDGDLYSKFNVQLNSNAYINGRVAVENLTMNDNAKIKNNLQCASPPINDYVFNITSEPDALTCEPHSISIQVLLDGNPVSNYVGVINLSTSTDKGVWSKLNADGTLTDLGSADNGQASYQFVASDQGVIELGLFNNSASELTVTVSSGAVSSVSGLISFRPYQLKSELSCNNGNSAAPCFNTANKSFDLKLTAVGKDPSTDSCKVIEQYTGDKELKFWSSYLNPVSPVGLDVQVKQTAIKKNAADAVQQTVTFASGVATVSVNYPDAGQIKIHARDEQGIGAPAEGQNDELQGSATTLVNPHKLILNNVVRQQRNLDPARVVSSAGFIRASVPDYNDLQVDTFDITVNAVKYCDDAATSAHCSNTAYGDKTPSFANEITLDPSLVFPVSASAAQGTVYSEDGLTQEMQATDKGQMTFSDLAFDEVGTLGLSALSDNYIVSGNTIAASDVKEIGRFYPDYLAYSNYSYSAGCGGEDFTYMMPIYSTTPLNQSAVLINYTLLANAQVSAGATAKVTKNYDASLGYPVVKSSDFHDFAYAKDLTDLRSRLFPSSYYDQTQWKSGVYTLSALPMGLQKASSADGPFFTSMPTGSAAADNHIEYYIQLTGIDGEKLQKDAVNPCSSDKCLLVNVTSSTSLGDFAYGRLQAGNGHGSEYQPIRTTIQATYFDGSRFATFTRDNCTAFTYAQLGTFPTKNSLGEVTITDGTRTDDTTVSVAANATTLKGGVGYINFSAPTNGVRGGLKYFVEYESVAPWLLDETNRGVCKESPSIDCLNSSDQNYISGTVQFGLFRGNDRIIYRMQTFNE